MFPARPDGTRAQAALTICTAAVPTLPATPSTRTVLPGRSAARFIERVMRGAVDHQKGRSFRERHTGRDRFQHRSRHADMTGETTVGGHRQDRVARLDGLDARTARLHYAGECKPCHERQVGPRLVLALDSQQVEKLRLAAATATRTSPSPSCGPASSTRRKPPTPVNASHRQRASCETYRNRPLLAIRYSRRLAGARPSSCCTVSVTGTWR